MTSQTKRMKIGLILPVFEGDMEGQTARWPDLCHMVQTAEEVGFDSLWIVDHLLSERAEQSDRKRQGPWECWSMLSAVAAVTNRVEIGPLVSNTGFRNPALLAKIADTVDEISGGRLILGLGAGWHEPEYTAFGFPFDHRFDRFEESLAIIHGLLRKSKANFEGSYHRALDCELRPRGPRPSGPPIMVGTNAAGNRVLGLAARYADMVNIWTVWLKNRPDDVPDINGRIDAACSAAGRDPSTLARSVAIRIDLPGRPLSPGEAISPITGTLDEIAAMLEAYANLGIAHVQVWLEPNSAAGIRAFAPVFDKIGRR